MGARGIELAARHCAANAHYLCGRLEELGFRRKYSGTFFHEFVTVSPVETGTVMKKLEEKGYLGGLPLSDREILWCATEKNTKEEMDQLTEILREVCLR